MQRSIVSEATSLQPKTRKRKLAFFSSVGAKGRGQLEFVNSDLHDTGIPLSECIEESFGMEKFTQVNSILEERFSLSTLDPLHESRALLVSDTDPRSRILRAFPALLPSRGDGVGHELGGFSFGLGSKHFGTLKDFCDRGDTFVDGLKEGASTLELHVDKLFDRVVNAAFRNVNVFEGLVSLVNILPQLADGAESFSPFFLVETDFGGTDRSKTLELGNDLARVETLNRSVDVARQAKDLWVVDLR